MALNGDTLAAARMAAADAVTAPYAGRALTAAEKASLRLDLLKADSGAITAHIQALAQAAFVGAVVGPGLVSATGGPVTGNLTVAGGTIT
jgi:hypothetical protein